MPVQIINPTTDSSQQSDEQSNQEVIPLPATPTRAQPTLTAVVAVRHRISPEELAPNLAWGGFGGGGGSSGGGNRRIYAQLRLNF